MPNIAFWWEVESNLFPLSVLLHLFFYSFLHLFLFLFFPLFFFSFSPLFLFHLVKLFNLFLNNKWTLIIIFPLIKLALSQPMSFLPFFLPSFPPSPPLLRRGSECSCGGVQLPGALKPPQQARLLLPHLDEAALLRCCALQRTCCR